MATAFDVYPATIIARDGQIAAIEEHAGRGPAADVTIDATGLIVAPGGIDPHTHFEEPGPNAWREGFETGTMACAAGGVTTTLEHPLSIPPVADSATFLAKREVAAAHSVIDFGLWGGLLPTSIGRLEEMWKLGAVAFKGLMASSAVGTLQPDNFPMVDDASLVDGMKEAAKLGALIGLHAESDALTKHFTAEMVRLGHREPRAIEWGRPQIAELEAIERALVLARYTGARTHIVHMSIADGAAAVDEARRGGVRATAETSPHYLHLTADDLDRIGAYGKCKPPLRSRENVERMWDAVLEEKISFIASDHAPYGLTEKDGVDIWDAPWGIAGAQTMLPVLISDGLLDRHWDLRQFVRFTSTNCARVFGIYPQKGSIRVGSDADFVLIDLNDTWTVTANTLFHRHPWSPYLGETFKGRVATTIVRGRVVFDAGRIMVDPGYGVHVVPTRDNRGAA